MSQGIGGYLMDAAQTFGDNLTAIFDRIGELATGAASALTGAIGGGAATATVATVASGNAESAAVSANGASPAAAVTGMEPGQGMDAGADRVIYLPTEAIASVQSVRESQLALEWQSADIGQVLGNLPKPLTPGMDTPAVGTGISFA